MLLYLLCHRLSSHRSGSGGGSSGGGGGSGSVWRRDGGVQGSRQPGWNLHPWTDQLSRYGGCSSCIELRLSCSLLGCLLRLLDLLLLQCCTGLESLDLELVLLLLLTE